MERLLLVCLLVISLSFITGCDEMPTEVNEESIFHANDIREIRVNVVQNNPGCTQKTLVSADVQEIIYRPDDEIITICAYITNIDIPINSLSNYSPPTFRYGKITVVLSPYEIMENNPIWNQLIRDLVRICH